MRMDFVKLRASLHCLLVAKLDHIREEGVRRELQMLNMDDILEDDKRQWKQD